MWHYCHVYYTVFPNTEQKRNSTNGRYLVGSSDQINYHLTFLKDCTKTLDYAKEFYYEIFLLKNTVRYLKIYN